MNKIHFPFSLRVNTVAKHPSNRHLAMTTLALTLGLPAGALGAEAQATDLPMQLAAASPDVEEVQVDGRNQERKTATRLPFALRELPQSISEISQEMIELTSMTDMNDLMMNVTGVNVTLYDTQRPLYFARGFQITDFQVDGIPTYSGSTNQEYDTALYERVEVIRGANGLLSGVGTPSATVNLVRKRPGKTLDASVSASVSSWDRQRGVVDVSTPLTSDGKLRSRVVVAYQDSDSFRDRYREDKTAVLGVVEGDIGEKTTVAVGYQNQDNNPEGTIWGTIPLFAADGSKAKLPVSTSFAPEWTTWQRESSTLFADVEHNFNEDWKLRFAVNRTEGDVFSLRVYAQGFPDRETGEGVRLLAGVGAGDDTRDSIDLYLTGDYQWLGREHTLIVGTNSYEMESNTPGYTSVASWSYLVPNAWNYDGKAPQPTYSRTGAFRIATTEQMGVYTANRFSLTNSLSAVIGARVTSWETGTDNYNTTGAYVNKTGTFEVDNELTSYAGLIYDLSKQFSLYASYTDIFNPQNYKDKDNNLLEPVLGSNAELGVKGEFFDGKLLASTAVFKTKQDNYAVRDMTQPENSLPDGSSAYVGVDGTESEGIELSLSGNLSAQWVINAGYTYVDTKRHTNDRIWTNLPEHSVQLSSHYHFSGALAPLVLGGGVNWQSETIGYGVTHPTRTDATFTQDSYLLTNLYATWNFNESWTASLSATNVFDEIYWANIDYANYGEPRNVSLTVKWKL
ncbi:TonB-dependent siderophore receptor [Cellvibrio sp. QJXJ]|uniref:TonB-dependent siderophore receptor n=1 Tax=Cellvibrio sp. QJXJ TaxID=2964606 RepID=UPI0021C40A5B|nr:TonB-dependent siderophore receptor [Cellvibrio sp. QJXJ]UUA73438.1 TonB-dependent siderophore receptor [Cellvibrio sp. QJXJ]